jgi:hypothetical protein
LQRQLNGCPFSDADDLRGAVREILDGFKKPTLIKVVKEKTRRLEQYIKFMESTLDEPNSSSGFTPFGSVIAEMQMGTWDTLFILCTELN